MRKLFAFAMLITGALLIVSCGNDEGETLNVGDITISGLPSSATIAPNATYIATVTIESKVGLAEAGLSQGSTIISETTFSDSPTTATVDISYEVGATGTYELVFTVVDVDGTKESATLVIIAERTYEIIDATESRGPNEENVAEYPQKQITGIINENVTLTPDFVWVLNGRVIVDAGATLTIEPGTIIKGAPGQGALSSVLLVAAGATIDAQGTESNPIVMTALSDHINVEGADYYDGTTIQSGSDAFTSQGLSVATDIGLWGGLIILGDAPISSGDGESTTIEGIPSSVTQASYGGTTSNDNSGTLTYVSLRFTGTQLGPGNELQGLTVGGVGSETMINWVESIASADDGTEIFGGTVNMSNFIVWGQEDDGYDGDQAWTGTIDNFVYLGTNATADHAFELDGPEGTSTGIGHFTNGTVWGANSSGMIDFRDDAEYSLDGVFFFNFTGSADIEMDEDSDSYSNSSNYVDASTITLVNLQFYNNSNVTLADILDAKGDGTNNYASLADTKFEQQDNNNEVIGDLGSVTVGADLSNFGWSYAAQAFAGWGDMISNN